jgi:hypothetical protein
MTTFPWQNEDFRNCFRLVQRGENAIMSGIAGLLAMAFFTAFRLRQ